LKFFIFTENKQCGTRLEYGIWRNCHINFVVFPDGNNIDSEFFPDIQLTDFEQINSIIRSVNTWGIESMRIGELKHKDLPMYRKQGKIEALKAAREKASYLVEAMGQELGEVIRIVEPVDNNISRYLPFQAQSNVSMGTAATEQYRVIKLRYEMTARFAIK